MAAAKVRIEVSPKWSHAGHSGGGWVGAIAGVVGHGVDVCGRGLRGYVTCVLILSASTPHATFHLQVASKNIMSSSNLYFLHSTKSKPRIGCDTSNPRFVFFGRREYYVGTENSSNSRISTCMA